MLQKNASIVITTLFLLIFSVQACKDSASNDDYISSANCTGSTPTYNAQVKSIMTNSCATSGCHNATSKKDGIDLSTYALTKNIFLNGKGLCTIYHDCTPMPENAAKLSDATILLLTCWVKNNCPEN